MAVNPRRPGLTVTRARVDEIIPQRNRALCVDSTGTRFEVPLHIRRAKGGWPQVGETWLLAREFGSYWTFAAIMDDESQPIMVKTPREVLNAQGQAMWDEQRRYEAGHVVAQRDPLLIELLEALVSIGVVREPQPPEGPHGD